MIKSHKDSLSGFTSNRGLKDDKLGLEKEGRRTDEGLATYGERKSRGFLILVD